MDKDIQRIAWSCLPKEFKEEVKETYREYTEKIATTSEPEYRIVGYIAAQTELELLFGKHNLTSGAVEEVMLTVPRKKVQRAYNTSREIVKAENPDSLMYSLHTQIMCILENIFGSKCLPDAHEDNFTTKEPKPAETKNEGTRQEQYVPKNTESGTHSFSHILKDGFRDHNRLHIAAMIAQGIMANSNPQMVDTNVERVVDLAILTADTLIAKCEKGGDNA